MFEKFKSKEKRNYDYIADGLIVKIKRSSGNIEDGWVVLYIDKREGRVLVVKQDPEKGLLRKKISIEEVAKLNPADKPLKKHSFED